MLPIPPTNFTHTTSVQEISLSWDPPDQSSHFIEGYIVGYGQFLPEVFRETISNQENGFTITGLGNVLLYNVIARIKLTMIIHSFLHKSFKTEILLMGFTSLVVSQVKESRKRGI